MTLGKYPSHRYSRSWVTQRLFNRAPAWSHVRKNAFSVGQQITNPLGLEIQDTLQQLIRERYNQHISSADISQLDLLYRFDLPVSVQFTQTERADGSIDYVPPVVYATINDIEYQITAAENNDLNTLGYDCLPSRIEDGDISDPYQAVVPRTLVTNLSSVTPSAVPINGHLYVTIRDNTNWEIRTSDKIFYSKVYISGITRKGTEVTEVLPIRYNGTFKTINQWQSVSSIFVSYMSDTAYITVESFPDDRESYIDTFNVLVEPDAERFGFLRLQERSYGSVLVTEGFVSPDFDIVRSGHDEKEIYKEIELLDESGVNINAIDFFIKPHTRFAYVIDENYLYVYDISFPNPDCRSMSGESPDTKMDLYSDRWICNKDEEVYIKTRTLSFTSLPFQTRWSILSPSGTTSYLALDGSTSLSDAWLSNPLYGDGNWREQSIPLTFSESGEWIVSIECMYLSEQTNETFTYTTKFLFFVPSIEPEIQLELPDSFKNADKIGIDSDGKVWIQRYGTINLLNVFHDYFITDYDTKKMWFREEYSNVRVIP